MKDPNSHEVTQILQEWNSGDDARARLMPLVYDELRRLAQSYLRRERPDHTLQPTALVHEAYLRLVDQSRVEWRNRVHFYGVAAQMMRRILIDHARAHASEKRSGGARRLSLDEAAVLPEERAADLVALDDALKLLADKDERKSRVVELRFFGGLSVEETAEALGLHTATVERDWRFAKMWLHRELSGDVEGDVELGPEGR